MKNGELFCSPYHRQYEWILVVTQSSRRIASTAKQKLVMPKIQGFGNKTYPMDTVFTSCHARQLCFKVSDPLLLALPALKGGRRKDRKGPKGRPVDHGRCVESIRGRTPGKVWGQHPHLGHRGTFNGQSQVSLVPRRLFPGDSRWNCGLHGTRAMECHEFSWCRWPTNAIPGDVSLGLFRTFNTSLLTCYCV